MENETFTIPKNIKINHVSATAPCIICLNQEAKFEVFGGYRELIIATQGPCDACFRLMNEEVDKHER